MRKWRILFSVLVVAIIYLLCYVLVSAQEEFERGVYREIEIEGSYDEVILEDLIKEEVVVPEKETKPKSLSSKYILLGGLDGRSSDFSGRTDALMVLELGEEVKLLSIPRDSYVDIIGLGKKDKINHAYANGGIKMLKSTINELLDIEIDNYILVGFGGFEKIIDRLGGVKVEVDKAFTEQDRSGKGNVWLSSGEQVLDGREALAYVRMRKSDVEGDLGRGKRQQAVMESLVDELFDIRQLPKILGYYKDMSGEVMTDIGLGDVVGLLKYAKDLDGIKKLNLTGKGMNIGGVYYLGLDEEVLDKVKEELGGVSYER